VALARLVTAGRHEVISTDLFDTLLLRDHTTETYRLALSSSRAGALLGVDPDVLTRLRWSSQDVAYRAVAMERPEGEATLTAICATVATALGLGDDAARVLHDTEVDVDIAHLRANRALLALLEDATRRGLRVIAVSDTYYGEMDLHRMLAAVVGPPPLAAVYSSADIGLTKHAGGLFDEVAKRENVVPEAIVHVGDHPDADVRQARAAGWTAVHLPRDDRHRMARRIGKALAVPARIRRSR
jgi:FMN phosphatase YigB (HAD superfamily)